MHEVGSLDKIIQFSSVTQSCQTPCDPMNRSTPGLPDHHQLPEFTQTRVHRVSDAIQPSHPRSSPSPAPSASQHRGQVFCVLLEEGSSCPEVSRLTGFSCPWSFGQRE